MLALHAVQLIVSPAVTPKTVLEAVANMLVPTLNPWKEMLAVASKRVSSYQYGGVETADGPDPIGTILATVNGTEVVAGHPNAVKAELSISNVIVVVLTAVI